MTLKADLAAAAVTALNDIRCAAVRLTIEDILKRRTHGGGVPEFRVYYRGTDDPVESFEELLLNFVEENILLTYDMVSIGGNFRDKCKPVTLLLKNLEVRFLAEQDEDTHFTVRYGHDAINIIVTLSYASDNDSTVPLKAIDASVVPRRNLI